MRAVLATAIVLAGVLVAGASRSPVAPAGAAGAEAAKPYGAGPRPEAQVSSASCAASACHGGGHVGRRGSEHSTWAPDLLADGPHDPHSRAYRVLFNADSVRMGKLLAIAAPHEHGVCLKCHAVDGVKPEPAVAEGVGCGACHGPAEKWLAAHVEPGWKDLTSREKWEYGFVPAGNLVARSLNCVGCHVGDADREVSHDLIAAGHPRLAFESVRFHTAPHYRKHWKEESPDFAVRAWVVGQAASMRAATELLHARADRAAHDRPGAVWPEFAGSSCSTCHQRVGLSEFQAEAGANAPPAGLPGWEVWSNATAPVAAKLCGDVFPGAPAPELREIAALRALMQKRIPDPRAVAAQAAKAVAELDAWLAALQAAEDRGGLAAPDSARKVAHELAKGALSPDRAKLADRDWDALAARYLGCAAMHHTNAAPAWAAPLRGLRDELRFPAAKAGVGVPAEFGRKERDRARDLFRELFDATESKR